MKPSNQTFSVILSDFLSLFFPNYCSSCDLTLSKSETLICTHCKQALIKTHSHLIPIETLQQRFFEIPNLQHALAYCWFQKGTPIQTLLHQLKYGGNEAIGNLLGEMYGEELRSANYQSQWDLITTVPLHYKKFRIRGFNQSDRIAEGLSKSLGIPFVRIIRKTEHRKSQTKKHRLERFRNVDSTFSLLKTKEKLSNKRILVVDDVLTTGATIQAACQPLLKKKALISVLSIAVAR